MTVLKVYAKTFTKGNKFVCLLLELKKSFVCYPSLKTRENNLILNYNLLIFKFNLIGVDIIIFFIAVNFLFVILRFGTGFGFLQYFHQDKFPKCGLRRLEFYNTFQSGIS